MNTGASLPLRPGRWLVGRHCRRRLGALLLACLAGVLPAGAETFYYSPDVAVDASTGPNGFFRPWDIVRSDDGGTSSLEESLPDDAAVDALYRMSDGRWLLSFEASVELPAGSGTVYTPGDIVTWDGAAYQIRFDASAEGLPDDANVDAVFLRGGDAGTLVLSFDECLTIDGTTYDPADLVSFAGGVFSLFFDASATTPPIPATTNVTAADERHGTTVISFDVPVTLGTTTYLPGQLVAWDPVAGTFSPVHDDPSWSPAAALDGTSYLPGPGRIGASLRVARSSTTPGNLVLSWGPACSSGAEDFGIYEGSLENIYSHVPITCTDSGGDLQEEVTPGSGNRYYLVVPHNGNDEGSYGIDSAALERPSAGANSCRASQEIEPCP